MRKRCWHIANGLLMWAMALAVLAPKAWAFAVYAAASDGVGREAATAGAVALAGVTVLTLVVGFALLASPDRDG